MIQEILHEWQQIVTDPGHVLAELTFACFEAAVGFVIGRSALRRHDRRVHGHD